MYRNDPQTNSRIKFEAKMHAMLRMAENLQPNHVYMLTITDRIEKEDKFTPYDTYVVGVLAQEITGNERRSGETNSNEGEGRTSI